MTPKLTLLVFLKDRASFTKRLCDYLSNIHYPYPVYFADGSIGQDNEIFFKNLEEQKFFYTYKRYPPDNSFFDYYKKCHSSIREITTPYVMLADNDDFPIIEGQKEALQFLELHPDFIGCNGRVAGITLSPDSSLPCGKNFMLNFYYSQEMDVPAQLNQNSSLERIESYLTNFYSIFYSVFRTKILINSYSQIEDMNFSDLGIYELFFSYYCLVQGKIHSINKITYIRQKGSSQCASTQKDWFYRLFHTNWLQDSQKALREVAHYIDRSKEMPFQKCYNILADQLSNKMRNRFISNEFSFFKNPYEFFLKKNIHNILLNKLFKRFPFLTERLSLKLSLDSAEQKIPSIQKMKSVITKI